MRAHAKLDSSGIDLPRPAAALEDPLGAERQRLAQLLGKLLANYWLRQRRCRGPDRSESPPPPGGAG
jgi:hypothetical protein